MISMVEKSNKQSSGGQHSGWASIKTLPAISFKLFWEENPSISCSSRVVHSFRWLVFSSFTKDRGVKCCKVDMSREQSNITVVSLN